MVPHATCTSWICMLTARKQGAGKALMARAASIAREASAEEMIWSVYQSTTIAATFYEKLGSQRITDVFFMKLSADKI
jgi:ribosomal protein S18 acetylase RimI-like enzyme